MELAQPVFNHFLQINPIAGEIVDQFKKFLFQKFKVPEDIQRDVKAWVSYLMKVDFPIKPPPLCIHPPYEHWAIDPPNGRALSIGLFCQNPPQLKRCSSNPPSLKSFSVAPGYSLQSNIGDNEPQPKSTASSSIKKASKVVSLSRPTENLEQGTSKASRHSSKTEGDFNFERDLWKDFSGNLPMEAVEAVPTALPKDVEEGHYGIGLCFYNPTSEDEIKSPDLIKLVQFMSLDSKNHVLLSRPLIDEAKRMIYRQYGRMRTEIFPMADQKKYKQVVITWFKSAYKAEIVGNSNVEYYRFWQGKHGQLGSYDRHLFFDPNPFEIQNWVGNYYKLVSPQAEYICPFIRCSLPDQREGGEKENEDQPAVPDHDKEGEEKENEDQVADSKVPQDSPEQQEFLPAREGGAKEDTEAPAKNEQSIISEKQETSARALDKVLRELNYDQDRDVDEERPQKKVLRTSSRAKNMETQPPRCDVLGMKCPKTPTFAQIGRRNPSRCNAHKEPGMLFKKKKLSPKNSPQMKRPRPQLLLRPVNPQPLLRKPLTLLQPRTQIQIVEKSWYQ